MKAHINKLFDAIYLALSDCDGMCEHCNERLKRKCIEWKRMEYYKLMQT